MTEQKSVFASLSHICKRYGEQVVFDDLNMQLYSGEIVCVLGESGGGKTTLLNMLASLAFPDAGSVDFFKNDGDAEEKKERVFSQSRRKKRGDFPRVSYAFQEDRLLPNLSALGNLKFVGGEEEYCRSLLSRAELSDKENSRPSALSGGEKQRVSLLRAFSHPFDLFLADEPFSALDAALKERMISLFKELWRERGKEGEKRCAVLVTHSIKEALAVADRVVVFRGGKIAEDLFVPTDEREKSALLSRLFSAVSGEEIGENGDKADE